ncbi:phosphoribosylaminoimidazole-succinocarboxamide synthase [Halosimplex carlsbadense 2-9-1]|uniref:phosphoribosylaminoimidazolesuccinocarboxamide synthase n=1 Tax=Halosimplex carlsbadense 2-9-1 TaxID=797114 RepID=M0D2C7_9EURY|nr:phosphoribosylaminoimidazolesuccinocarboxamide synthase [Halosimplex carlsbadense]ELZ29590.1 phosphoribosylaminoimidazole-succinocarboxamide synthase [Halosimplex carlsbadense 2-9-1]
MTSVKEFRVDEPATADSLGRGAFVFTDDYSVFDWGKMPDEIPDKGASLCTMGAFNFELLESEGVPTHYEGVTTDATDGAVPLDDALDAAEQSSATPPSHAREDSGAAPREMVIELTQVPDLPFEGDESADPSGYDYDAYHADAGENYLVPLEIVFRNRVPVGSSLRTRTDPADHGLDFDAWPDEAVDLDDPVVEFSTKYEEQDRYLAREEADRIAGTASIDDLESIAREANAVVTDRAADAGLTHEDGKIECLYYEGEVRVADVVGTFDENRFSYGDQQVSKEVVRQYHKRTQPEWVEAVSAAKAEADERGVADWKSLCERRPEPLDDRVVEAARDLYCAGTNAYVGRDAFDAPSLEAAVDAVRDL